MVIVAIPEDLNALLFLGKRSPCHLFPSDDRSQLTRPNELDALLSLVLQALICPVKERQSAEAHAYPLVALDLINAVVLAVAVLGTVVIALVRFIAGHLTSLIILPHSHL